MTHFNQMLFHIYFTCFGMSVKCPFHFCSRCSPSDGHWRWEGRCLCRFLAAGRRQSFAGKQPGISRKATLYFQITAPPRPLAPTLLPQPIRASSQSRRHTYGKLPIGYAYVLSDINNSCVSCYVRDPKLLNRSAPCRRPAIIFAHLFSPVVDNCM